MYRARKPHTHTYYLKDILLQACTSIHARSPRSCLHKSGRSHHFCWRNTDEQLHFDSKTSQVSWVPHGCFLGGSSVSPGCFLDAREPQDASKYTISGFTPGAYIYIYMFTMLLSSSWSLQHPNVLERRLLGQAQDFPNWFRTTLFRTGFELFELVHKRSRTTSTPENNTRKKEWPSKLPSWLIQASKLQLVGKHGFRTKPVRFPLFELVGGRVCMMSKAFKTLGQTFGPNIAQCYKTLDPFAKHHAMLQRL